jgi:hypothetical protein
MSVFHKAVGVPPEKMEHPSVTFFNEVIDHPVALTIFVKLDLLKWTNS